ncbi:MAG: hypothetical protein WCY01_07895 [Alkalispirochaeta sp.]
MSDKELYRQKKQAQLDEWQADVDKLKAKVSRADADVQLKMNKQIRTLESKIADGKAKLSQLAEASDAARESLKEGVESAWDSLKSAVSDAASKFKD